MSVGSTRPTDCATVPQTFLTTSEVAGILRCSEKTILRRVSAGKLPSVKDGGRYLFEATAIRTLFVARMVRPKSEGQTMFPVRAPHADVSNPTD